MVVNYGRRARLQKGEHYTKASRASLCEFRFTARGLFSYLRSNSTTKPVIAIIFGRVTSTHKSEASENIIFFNESRQPSESRSLFSLVSLHFSRFFQFIPFWAILVFSEFPSSTYAGEKS